MHPTADTYLVINSSGVGRRVIGSVRMLHMYIRFVNLRQRRRINLAFALSLAFVSSLWPVALMARTQGDTSSTGSSLKESESALQELFVRVAAARRAPGKESDRAVKDAAARINGLIEILGKQRAARQDSADAPLLRERIDALREYMKMAKPANERDLFQYVEVDKPARLTYKPEPGFTDEARQAKVSGRVRVRVVLSPDGAVKHIVPSDTLGYGLTERTVNAARQVKFEPAMRGGRIVSQVAIFEYHFNQ